MGIRKLSVASGLLACASPAIPCAAQPSFTGIGIIGEGVSSWTRASAVSNDGATVFGWMHCSSCGQFGRTSTIRWTRADGIVELAGSPTGAWAPKAASADGSVCVGYAGDPTDRDPPCDFGVLWDSAAGVTPFEDCVRALGVSADGETVVGTWGWNAAIWTSKGGWHFLDMLPAFPGENAAFGAQAVAVTPDTSAIAGFTSYHPDYSAFFQAFIWRRNEGTRAIFEAPGPDFSTKATGVSADGETVVGNAYVTVSGSRKEAFRWSKSGGFQRLGDLPGGVFYSEACGVSGDGERVVGVSEVAARRAAFIWDERHGMRDLALVLEREYHLDVRGWQFHSAEAVTPDGRTVVGVGLNPQRQTEGWIARLDPVCTADWDRDGVVDPADVFAFLGDFLRVDADFNASGGTDSRDFFEFLSAFFAGCV